MTKIAGSGFISQRHGSADPDPYQYVDANLSEMKILSCNPDLIFRNFDGKQQQEPKLEIFGSRVFTQSGLYGW
jgi:hypothetical protein